ncbi:MAG: biotin/lipoyl-containing protein [Pseudomonadota bacterium]
MESMTEDGKTRTSGGVLRAFDPPHGPGVRVDTFGYAGYQTSPRFDSLLAKVIVHSASPKFSDAVTRAYRALAEFRIDGISTNIPFLQNLLWHPNFSAGRIYTTFVDDHIAELAASGLEHPKRFFAPAPPPRGARKTAGDGWAGARIDTADPLAVLDFGQTARDRAEAADAAMAAPPPEEHPAAMIGPEGTVPVLSPMQGTIVAIVVSEGEAVRAGRTILIMDSMKMEHEITADCSGVIRQIGVEVGDTIIEGHPLAFIEEGEVESRDLEGEEEIDLDEIRPDLQRILDRLDTTYDHSRQWAVERRRARGQRTTRESIGQLLDDDEPFLEYGQLVLAAQRQRRSLEDLIAKTSSDGMVIGVGVVNGDKFKEPASSVAVIAYDYTVLAGIQGSRNHRKTDRMLHIAHWGRLPLIFGAGRDEQMEREPGCGCS